MIFFNVKWYTNNRYHTYRRLDQAVTRWEEYKHCFVFTVVGIGEGTKMLTTMLAGSKVSVSWATLYPILCVYWHNAEPCRLF